MCELMLAADFLNFEIIGGLIAFVYLLILTVQDVRSRMVSMWLLIGGIAAALLYQIAWGNLTLFECMAGAVIGIGFVGISKVTREGIGYGDSILILALGIYLG